MNAQLATLSPPAPAPAQAVAILDGSAFPHYGHWQALAAAAVICRRAGMTTADFLDIARPRATELCIKDRCAISEADSKSGRAWNAAGATITAGGTEAELDLLDTLGSIHAYWESQWRSGQPEASNLLGLRAIIIVAASAHTLTGLSLPRYRLSEIANLTSRTMASVLKRLTGLGCLVREQTAIGKASRFSLVIPENAPAGHLDFGDGWAHDLFTTGYGGIGPNGQRIMNALPYTGGMTVPAIAAETGLSLTTVKKALGRMETSDIAAIVGKAVRANLWVRTAGSSTDAGLLTAAEHRSVQGTRADRVAFNTIVHAEWVAAGKPTRGGQQGGSVRRPRAPRLPREPGRRTRLMVNGKRVGHQSPTA